MPSTPTYTCRLHALPLIEISGQAVCPQCTAPFAIQDAIWYLDLTNRPDRAAFDEQVDLSPIPLDPQKAVTLLQAAQIQPLQNANILDVGCGLGDLTFGLAHSPAISDSDIYAFDHSVQSLRRASRNGSPANGNRVHFSAQDGLELFFPNTFFDLVAGSAVLHHFLDYPSFFHELARVLKPGATAVFAEPFYHGYFWPVLFLKNAMAQHHADRNAPEFLHAGNIIALVEFMARNRGNHPALEHLTDKHFFLESEIQKVAAHAGFQSVRFTNLSPPQFYDNWMSHFMDIYGVTDPAVRQSAIAQYAAAAESAGPLLPELMSHFKYIVLTNAGELPMR